MSWTTCPACSPVLAHPHAQGPTQLGLWLLAEFQALELLVVLSWSLHLFFLPCQPPEVVPTAAC